VDWWGINYFSSDQINSSDPFLVDAATHNKPVMVCEASPIHGGGATSVSNWNQWYASYFEKMETSPHIKAFVYISDPWDRHRFISDWADSRINTNSTDPTIRTNYTNEMNQSKYIHMKEYVNKLSRIQLYATYGRQSNYLSIGCDVITY